MVDREERKQLYLLEQRRIREEERREKVHSFVLQAMSILKPPKEFVGKDQTREEYEGFVQRAYRIADAMMAEDDRRWEEKWKDVTFI